MSKIAKTPVDTTGVQVQREGNILHFTGKNGKAVFHIPESVEVQISENNIKIVCEDSCLAGTAKSNLKNTVQGLKEKFNVTLKLAGVGYKVFIDGKDMVFNVGYSHEVRMTIPENITAVVPKSSSPILEISSVDKVAVTTLAGKICKIKRYNPYKQYGILWDGKEYLTKQLRAKR
jgi:large subunit ribosomal protein L6